MVELLSLFVQSHKDIQGMNKLVLYRLLQIFKPPFEIKFSIGELASRLRLNKSQVTSAINTLLKVGFLHKEDDFDRRRGGGRIIRSTDCLEDYLARLEEVEWALPNASVALEILDQITKSSREDDEEDDKGDTLQIGSKGKILLAALIALSDEDGVVKSITFSTLAGISGLKRTGVQGVIRKLRAEGIIAFYQPGRLTAILSKSKPEESDESEASSSLVWKRVVRSGTIYLNLAKLSDSNRFLSLACSSSIDDDYRKLKQLGSIFSIPDLPDEITRELAYRCAIDKCLYDEMKGYRGILGQYMEKRSRLDSLISTVYLSLNTYFSEFLKCPLVLLSNPYVSFSNPEGLLYLRTKWELSGFPRPFNTVSRFSVHLLERYSKMIFEEVRGSLKYLEWPSACTCTEEKSCFSMRVLPLDNSYSSFLLLLRSSRPD